MTIAPNKPLPMVQKQIHRVVCPHDCPDTCMMNAHVQDGKVVKVTGDAGHPMTQGYLCIKTNYYLERLYSPERILQPLKRVGRKGEGKFEPTTWDDALETIAAKFYHIIEQYGAEAILPYSYAGNMGKLAFASMDRRLFNYIGASQLNRNICSTAGGMGYSFTMGAKMGTDPETIVDSKLIIAWGANIVSTNVHLMPFINEAKKRGAKLITVDPHFSKTAEQSDLVIQPYPGTDAALALAMMNVIISEDLHDKEFIAKHTYGYEQLLERVKEYPPERAEKICGVSAQQIHDFARLYATIKPSFIRLNYGMQRHTNGGMAVRTVTCLPAIVGAWGVPGGGALLSTSETFGLRFASLERTDFLKRHTKIPRTINMVRLGEALLDIQDPPVKALFVYNSNPAVVAPNQARVLAGLEREDLFTVVHEQVMTDTALYADIVLPATTTFEDFDLHTAYGHLYLQLSKPAIAPMGEARTNVQMFKALAKALKLPDPCFDDTEEDMIRQALSSNHAHVRGITYEQLEQEQFVRLNLPRPFVPFADGKYPTPSGKIEFYSENMLRQGFDPVPNHNPTPESADGNPELFAKYPVRLVTPAAHHFLNSSFADMPTMIKKQLFPSIELNQVDAEERSIKHGEWVRAWNDRGEAFFIAEIKDTVAPGVACHLSLWWNKHSPKGFNCNVLTSDTGADMGEGGTFHTNLIQIEKASNKLSDAEIAGFNAMFPATTRFA